MIRLMIVDDEKLLRQGFKHMLDWAQHGYEIVGEATNGVEALQRMEECDPDVIVTDVKMPLMDGMQFTRILRERYPRKIVVVLSSYSNFEYVRETLTHGAVDYVLKPELDSADLVEVLKAAELRIREDRSDTTNNVQATMVPDSFLALLRGNPAPPFVQSPFEIDARRASFLVLSPLGSGTGTTTRFSAEVYEIVRRSLSAGEEFAVPYACEFPESNCHVALVETSLESPEDVAETLSTFCTTQDGHNVVDRFLVSNRIGSARSIAGIFERMREAMPALFYEPVVRLKNVVWQDPPTVKLDYAELDQEIAQLRLRMVGARVKQVLHGQSQTWPRELPAVLKTLASEACFHTVKRLSELGISSDEINETRFEHLIQVERTDTLESLEQTVEAIFAGLEDAALTLRRQLPNPVVHRVKDFIQMNYRSAVTLSDLAERFSINKSYLSHLFKKTVGVSVVDFVSQCRVELAKDLLRSTNQTIYEIATSAGFEDANYFSKVFKKVAGLSPSSYRKIFSQQS